LFCDLLFCEQSTSTLPVRSEPGPPNCSGSDLPGGWHSWFSARGPVDPRRQAFSWFELAVVASLISTCHAATTSIASRPVRLIP